MEGSRSTSAKMASILNGSCSGPKLGKAFIETRRGYGYRIAAA